MTNFMKRAADAVVDKLLELMQRDRAAQEAKPKSAESPLIVIPIPRWRTYVLFLGITVAFFGLAGRAFWLQVVSNDFLQDEGEKRYARTLTIAGERGEILDRNGVVLATTEPAMIVSIDPDMVRTNGADKRYAMSERKQEAQSLLRLAAVPEGVENRLWKHLDDVYFMRHEPQDIAWHARVLNRLVDTTEPVVRARMSRSHEGIKVLVYLPDQPDLFARICAFFGHTSYSIADARIYTTRNGYALDTFHVFLPEHHDGEYRDMINFVEFELAAALIRHDAICPPRSGRIDRHLKFFPITPQVSIRPDDRDDYFVLSIVAGDRRGLLANISCVLAQYQVTVHAAKIMTLGSRVEDS